jgi:ATP-dependent Clp protease ATP-binding subunit ClpC
MFERYTENARRTIFVVRSGASHYGSSTIETEHLLLGILHEDKGLASRLSLTAQTIRDEIAKRTPPPKDPTPTAVDLPLSHESKRVLAYGAEESEWLASRVIGVEHLTLGLLREPDSFAARLLRQRGIGTMRIAKISSIPQSKNTSRGMRGGAQRRMPQVWYYASRLRRGSYRHRLYRLRWRSWKIY